jgi:hypothetical protein
MLLITALAIVSCAASSEAGESVIVEKKAMMQITIVESKEGTATFRAVCYVDPEELKRRNISQQEVKDTCAEVLRLQVGALVGLAVAHMFGCKDDDSPGKNREMLDDPEIRKQIQSKGVLLKPAIREMLKAGIFWERQEIVNGKVKVLTREVLKPPCFPELSSVKRVEEGR